MKIIGGELGMRKVRSAGRLSGSVELTLPPRLAMLEGLDCAIAIGGGDQLEIILRPDMAPVLDRLSETFSAMQRGLYSGAETFDLPFEALRIVPGTTPASEAIPGMLSLEDLAVIRTPAIARPDAFVRLVRSLFALDLYLRDVEADARVPLVRALAYAVTGDGMNLDLGSLDAVALALEGTGLAVPLQAGELLSIAGWTRHAEGVARISARFIARSAPSVEEAAMHLPLHRAAASLNSASVR